MKLSRSPLIVCTAMVAAIAGASEVRAATITSVFAGNCTVSDAPANGNNSIEASVSGSTAQVIASPDPTASVDVTGGGSDCASVPQANAGMDYTFTVNGPGSTVEIDISSASTTIAEQPASGYYQADTLGLVEPGGSFPSEYFGFTQLCYPSYECATAQNTANDIVLTVDVGIGNELEISAQALVDGTGELYAEIDPIISIDSSVSDASAYSITLSENAGNSPAGVPEPSSGLLIMLALIAPALYWRGRTTLPGRRAR